VPVEVGQAEVSPGVAVGELLVDEAKEMENRGVKVVAVDFVDDGGETELVSSAVQVTGAHPPANGIGKP
jgi:hypothetical protein